MTFNIRKFFGLCEHLWVTIETYRIRYGYDKIQLGELHIQRCSKCGKVIRTKLLV